MRFHCAYGLVSLRKWSGVTAQMVWCHCANGLVSLRKWSGACAPQREYWPYTFMRTRIKRHRKSSYMETQTQLSLGFWSPWQPIYILWLDFSSVVFRHLTEFVLNDRKKLIKIGCNPFLSHKMYRRTINDTLLSGKMTEMSQWKRKRKTKALKGFM